METITLFYTLSIVFFLAGAALIAGGTILFLRERRSRSCPREEFRFVLLDEVMLVHSDEVIPL